MRPIPRMAPLYAQAGENYLPVVVADAASPIFDDSDLTSLFVGRDGSGGNPDPSETVGLQLDKSHMGGMTAAAYIASRPELITNGTFDNDTTSWVQNGTTISQEDGKLKLTGSGNGADRAVQEISTVVGDWYVFGADCIDGTYSGNTFNIGVTNNIAGTGAYTAANNLADGRHQIIFQATAETTYVVLRKDNMGVGETSFFDNASFKHIPGQHRRAAADNQRPVLDRRPVSGRRNLHPYSGVTTLSSTGMLSPSNTNGVSSSLVGSGEENGLPYIDVRFQGTTTSGFHAAYFEIFIGTSVTGQDMVQSVYTKLVGGSTNNITNIVHRCEPSSSTVKDDTPISLTDELVSTFETETSTADNTNNSYGIALTFPSGVAIDITIRIAAPQIEVGTTPTPYQAVTNDNDITETGVRSVYSLEYDGVDDGMSFDFEGGAGPADCSVFFAMKPKTQRTVLWYGTNTGFGAVMNDGDTVSILTQTGGTVYADGTKVNNRDELHDAIADDAFHIVEERNANISTWSGIEIGAYSSHELDGNLIGPIIVPTSKLTNSLRRSIETYLKRKAGIL